MIRYQVSATTLAIIRRLAPPHYATWRGAPSTFASLMAAYELCRRTNAPLPVYAGASEGTIYGNPSDNYAFRAWHDILHVRLGAEFNADGERAVALESARILLREGASADDARAVFADVWGQFEYEARHGEFPADQAGFVSAYLADPAAAVADRSFLSPARSGR